MQPVPGGIGRSPAAHPDDYVTTFDHANQDAEPGGYHVRSDNGVDTRLAAGTRAAAGRFTFPAGHDGKGTVLLNTSGSANGVTGVTARVDGDRTVTGTVSSGGICSAKAPYSLSFRIEFDRPFTTHGTWQGEQLHRAAGTLADKDGKDGSGVYLTFDTARHRAVNARVAISYTDVAGAAANLAGTPHLSSVEDLAAATHHAWNRELRRIQVAGGSEERTRVFYTALYHCLLEPRTLNDADGRYHGFDQKIHRVRPGHTWYGNFSGWDVYRTETPLLAFLAPDRASDMAQSMVDAADQSGWLPRWTLLNNQTNGMVGDPAPVMLAGTWALGAHDFDLDGALKYAVKAATRAAPERPDGYVERQAVSQWRANGFLRNGDSPLGSSAATSLEYAVDDFAVARLAAANGDAAQRRAFMRTAHNWQNLVDGADGTLGPPARRWHPAKRRQPRFPGRIPGGQRRAVPVDDRPRPGRARRRHGRQSAGRRPARRSLHRSRRRVQHAVRLDRQRDHLRCALGLPRLRSAQPHQRRGAAHARPVHHGPGGTARQR